MVVDSVNILEVSKTAETQLKKEKIEKYTLPFIDSNSARLFLFLEYYQFYPSLGPILFKKPWLN